MLFLGNGNPLILTFFIEHYVTRKGKTIYEISRLPFLSCILK